MLRLGSGLQLLPQVVGEGNAQGGGRGANRDRTQGGGQGLELGGLAPQGQDSALLEVEPLPWFTAFVFLLAHSLYWFTAFVCFIYCDPL